ncbi:MAG TPA: MFS transporter [Burkholderiaceae bacterium]|nr:MFS transporter [Burkholderiaceae bacterium]
MKRPAAIPFIMLTALLDVIGIGLIIPVLPILVGEFTQGRDTQAYWYGVLTVTFGLAQFLCAPLLGAISDRFGRRPVLLLGIGGLGVTFLVTALTHSLAVLVAVRLLGGALSANIAVAQAYVADITSVEKRTPALGKLGAMFGLGFVLGPMFGGLLGQIDLRLPFFAAAGMCAINWLYGLLVLPESLPAERRNPIAVERLNPFSSLAGLGRLQGVGLLVFAVAAASMAEFTLRAVWVLFTGFRFGWGPRENGISLFVVGLVVIIVQGGLLRALLKSMGERKLVAAGLFSGALAYAGYGLATHGWMLYALIVANFLAYGATTALQGIVSKAADPREQGRTMATLTSLNSVITVVAPILGTFVLGQVTHLPRDDVWVGAPFFLAAMLEAIAFLIAWRFFSRHPSTAGLAASGGAL